MHRYTLPLLIINIVVMTTARVVVKEEAKIKEEPAEQTKEDKIDPADVIRLLVDLFTLGVIIFENCGPHAVGGRCTDFFTAALVIVLVVVIVAVLCAWLGIELKQDARSVRNRQNAADGLRFVGLMGALSVANDRINTNELNRKCR